MDADGRGFLCAPHRRTNVASLSLARSASREREIAIRAALGASRARIVRQLLAESLTLAAISGLLGLLVAHAGIRLILAVKPGDLARLNEVEPRSASARLGLGALPPHRNPGWTGAGDHHGAPELEPSGQEGGRGIAGGVATRRIRRALVVTEFALAIILLVGAGLLVRSLWSVENVDPGFRPERVLSVALAPPASTAPAQRTDFYNRVLEQIESLPGVESAGITAIFSSAATRNRSSPPKGRAPVSERLRFRSDELSEGFFKTLGTPLLRGRFFSAADGPDSPRVAIINDAMARRLVARARSGGQEIQARRRGFRRVVYSRRSRGRHAPPGTGESTDPADVRAAGAESSPARDSSCRTSMDDPLKMAGAVQAAVRRVEKHAPVYGVTTLENQLGAFLTQRRFQTSLLIGFSVAALLMAAIGIYGLIQYSIATRTHEIGIRMAVGAQAGEIFRMIIGEGLKLSLTGLGARLVGALWLGRAGQQSPVRRYRHRSVTFLTVSLLLTAVATAGLLFPGASRHEGRAHRGIAARVILRA